MGPANSTLPLTAGGSRSYHRETQGVPRVLEAKGFSAAAAPAPVLAEEEPPTLDLTAEREVRRRG